jgi:signal transduction histidine kinase
MNKDAGRMPALPEGSAAAGSAGILPAVFTLDGLRGLALLLALIAAGLAGNHFKYPIFLNIDFLFGSIFALLVLQVFGPARGIIAAGLIAGYTYVLWNHSYAIIILTAEVAVVAWLSDRHRIGLVMADALYWLFVGMPLVYLLYHGVMDVPLGSVTMIMTKQAVNGITNALLARLIFTGFALGARTTLIAYRELIYNLLAFFALVPALVLLMITSHSDFTETDRNTRSKLYQSSLNMTSRLDVWLQNRSTAVIRLAEMAATRSPAQMQPRLEQAHAADVNFLRIGLRDTESTVTAYAPPVDEFGQSNIGKKFPERPYISILKQTLKPMLAEVVMGRIDTPKPIAILLAPVVRQGEYDGYVNAVLRLDQLRDYLEKSAGSDTMLYTVLDRKDQVILSNRQGQQAMTHLTRGEGTLSRLDDTTLQWVPTLPPTTPISERWKSSFYVSESPLGTLAGWKLVLEQPVAPFQKLLHARYTDALARLLLALFVALMLAEWFSRRITATTEQLGEVTHDLPAVLAAGEAPVLPASAVLESSRLIGNFKEMADALAQQFSANRALTATLEQRVADRTRELEARMEELRRSNADLEQFAYAASHDMRQPLRMISSYLQLLEAELKPLLNDDTRQNFHFATEGAQRMDQMLSALLDYSRVGRNNDNRVALDSRAVLDEALRILQPAINEALAEVRVEGDWGQAPQIVASRDEILRLLQNLIDNALKYRVEGRKPEVVVSAEWLESVSAQIGGGEWCFTVKDNGIGLLPGQEVRIFKVFERFQPRAKYPGTGIGLALCRKIVEHHGGRIWVESVGENLGCCFVFTLPAASTEQVTTVPGETP